KKIDIFCDTNCKSGFVVPENIAVACLDGSDNCDQTHPTLTSIRIDYKKMGIETGKLLIGLLNNNHDESEESRIVQFNYQIELRQST
ncbi:substrate-binding domain-containing protein, partial [Escherichia coli]